MAYSKVERSIWKDDTFRRMTRDARDVWQYLLTSPHSNRFGLYLLPTLYAAADLQLSVDEVRGGLAELEREGRIVYQAEAEIVFIRRHWKHNACENPNVVVRAVEELDALPYHAGLWGLMVEAIEGYCALRTKEGKPFHSNLVDAIRKRIGDKESGPAKPFGKGLGKAGGNESPIPEPEPEPEPEPIQEQHDAKASAGKPPRAEPTDTEPDPLTPDIPRPAEPDPLAEARGEAATLIRSVLWKGDQPPQTAPQGWNMGRDLSIWKDLLKQFTAEELAGGIVSVRNALHEELADGRPITMAFFHVASKRDRMSRAVAYWRKGENRRLSRERSLPVSFAEALEGTRAAS